MSAMSQIRRKRADTKVGSVEKQYGVDFDVRSDMELGKFLKKNGYPSLSKALNEIGRIQQKKKPK